MIEKTGYICSQCENEITRESDSISTGYGVDQDNKKVCFSCCGENDKQYMEDNGRIVLYLVKAEDANGIKGVWHVTNWPSSFKTRARGVSASKHNWGLERLDFWFKFNGFVWHGYNINNGGTEIAHCKRTQKTRFWWEW